MTLAKTQRLTSLFPDAYAARDPAALLYRLLDVIGAELTIADDGVKRLLKSHWVAYATGAGLDGLAAIFSVERRRLLDGSPEPDEAFRQRLRAVVPMFTGGGTVRAVRGAVRSALGLPFDLDSIPLPEALRGDLEALVTVQEYTGGPERMVADTAVVGDVSELLLTVDSATVQASPPEFTITFARGTGWSLRVERLDGPGLLSTEDLFIPDGSTLTLRADESGLLRAAVGLDDVTSSFRSLDGATPVPLPFVPQGRSQWRVTVSGPPFDDSVYDDHAFGPPDLHVELRWRRARPLTFEVHVPYHLQAVVDALRVRHGYTGQLFVFEGLPRETIQEVVDDTRAAGVEGSVHFTLQATDRLDATERLRIELTHRNAENTRLREALTVGSVQRSRESQDLTERIRLGGTFDVSTFDTDHGFN
jgi:hypothetical protein